MPVELGSFTEIPAVMDGFPCAEGRRACGVERGARQTAGNRGHGRGWQSLLPSPSSPHPPALPLLPCGYPLTISCPASASRCVCVCGGSVGSCLSSHSFYLQPGTRHFRGKCETPRAMRDTLRHSVSPKWSATAPQDHHHSSDPATVQRMKRPFSPSLLPNGEPDRRGFGSGPGAQTDWEPGCDTLQDEGAVPDERSPGGALPSALCRPKRERKHRSYTMCEVCNIQLNSAAQAQIHYNGKSHQKRLKQISRGKAPSNTGCVPRCDGRFKTLVKKVGRRTGYESFPPHLAFTFAILRAPSLRAFRRAKLQQSDLLPAVSMGWSLEREKSRLLENRYERQANKGY
ncbi:Zinc finger protein 385B [Liparis tanakae]|uniref:Zinc finger protein 385B n=1 Tax=Liparis tanakae TaxID=230148 RepID=A0A4Z2GH03_9TELE|nr:Zinc finger protein 385B [Liparis tanakae]